MAVVNQDKRRVILEAATGEFRQYGYKKTSMEDIARAAGVSRPSLYSYFENKEEIFRSLSQQLHEDALAKARVAVDENPDEPIAVRIQKALLEFNVSLFRLLDESPHGAELMDESSRLGGDIAGGFYTSFESLLAQALNQAAKAGELDLAARAVTPAEAAEVIRCSVVGLKRGAVDADGYQRRVEQFVRVYLAGLA